MYKLIYIFIGIISASFCFATSNQSSWWRICLDESNERVWQINDYVLFLHKEEVAANAEEMDYDAGQYWYYDKLDLKGGYALITGAVEGYKEYVLWRRSDGKDLVGELTVGCGPACSYDFQFYLGNGDEIKPIEPKEILPVDELNAQMAKLAKLSNEKDPVEYTEDKQLRYVFPQKGTAMEVHVVLGADELEIKLGKLQWNRLTFTVDYLHDEVINAF